MESHDTSETSPKKKTAKHSVSPKILSLFSNLTQKDAEKRVKTASLLVQKLASSERSEQEPAALSPAAQYCLTRLVRGLASSRAGAREGFFTGLVQLLRQLPAVSTAALLSTVDAQLPEVHGDARQGTEHKIGRLLAAGAAVRAGRADGAELRPLAAALLQDWTHRAYMPAMVATFVAELVQRVSEEQFQSEVWPELSPVLAAGWDGCIPERFWLLLVCRRQFPDVVDSRFLKQHWGSKKMLSPKNHAGIMEMIKVSASSLPVIHPLVTSLVDFAMSRPVSELVELCRSVLEPLLDDRTTALLVMAMIQLMVPHINTPELVECVLSPAVVAALVQLLPKRDQRTEQAARGLGSSLVSLVMAPDSAAELQLAVVRRLVSPPGSINLDHMTGTKILAQMLNGLKPEALEPFSEIALSAFDGTQEDQSLTPRGRAVACDVLCRLIQHPSTPGLTPLKQRLLERLFTAAMVRSDGISDELAHTALRAFFRALDHPVRRLSDLTALLRSLTAHQDRLLNSTDVSLRAPLSAEARAAWDATVAALRTLEAGAGPDTDVFVILLGHLSQQLFGADCQTAIEALQELHVCLKRQKARGRRRSAPSAAAGQEEPLWSEVVVDLLLSLLALNVHLLRSVVRSVFTLLAPSLSPEAVMHVFQSLDPGYSMNGVQNEEAGSDQSDGESDEEQEAEEDSEEDEDEDDEDDEESEADEDADEEEDAQVDDDAIETMRTQVKAALGDDDDAASIDMDDVPEEHFAQVDAALAAAFRVLRKDKRMKRGERQTEQEQAMMHFRIRVLDLADVYVRVCPRSVAALNLLPVLVSLLAACAPDARQAPLVGRLRACLSRLTAGGGRLADGHGVTPQLIAELLRDVLTSGARLPAVSLELGGLLAAAVRLLVRTSAQLEGDHAPVTDALRSALDAFFTDRECVYPARLFSQLLALPAWPGGWTLVAALLAALFSEQVRLYRRTQALQLLTAAFRHRPLVKAAPPAELDSVVERLSQHVQEVVSGVSSADAVRSKYFSSALEALLTLRRTAARLRLLPPRPQGTPLSAALLQLTERVSLSPLLRRLVYQLIGHGPTPASGDKSPKKVKKAAAAAAATAATAAERAEVTASVVEAPAPIEPAQRKRSSRPKQTAADADERDGSVDSGVAEVASDAEAPPKKKKRRSEGGRSAKKVKA